MNKAYNSEIKPHNVQILCFMEVTTHMCKVHLSFKIPFNMFALICEYILITQYNLSYFKLEDTEAQGFKKLD